MNKIEFVVTYAHLHTVVGRKGDTVKAGQSVGISGSTGRSTGDHLHVSIRYHKKPIDPDPLIRYIQRISPTRPTPSSPVRYETPVVYATDSGPCYRLRIQ